MKQTVNNELQQIMKNIDRQSEAQYIQSRTRSKQDKMAQKSKHLGINVNINTKEA